MAGTTYQELLDGVANYYGSGSDQWAQIAQYGVNQQTLPIIEQVPGVTITTSNSGKYLGYDYSNPFASASNPASAIDSNVQTGAYGEGAFNAQLPATAVTDPSTGTTTMQSGARTVSAGSTVATIADRASLAITGVALGTKLGKLIDSGIYALNPNWWDEHFPSINPETWDDIASTQGGKNFIRSLFGLQNDDATMYVDERLLAYTYMMLLANGAYTSAQESVLTDPEEYGLVAPVTGYRFTSTANTLGSDYYAPVETYPYMANIITSFADARYGTVQHVLVSANPVEGCVFLTSTGMLNIYTKNPVGNARMIYYTISGSSSGQIMKNWYAVRNDANSLITGFDNALYRVLYSSANLNPAYNITPINSQNNSRVNNVGYALLYGDISTPQPVEGIGDNPQASEHINPDTLINPTTGAAVTPNDSVDDVLQALKTQYPDLFNDSIYEDVPQPDGTTDRIIYIPVPYPDTTNYQQPISDTTPGINPQTTPQVNPTTRPPEITQQITDTVTQTPAPPDTGNGDTPTPIIPTGSANALYSIYNPSQGELNSFGAWLWSSNFVDQLLKLFNDPMQAIIGLHKVFAPPVISGTGTIKVGYLDSGVTSNLVGNQYTTIDCGSVDVSEYFGNVFDYSPFTQIYIYLPFVGIEQLDTGDVMRGRIGVTYHVDVLTGACLAEITVIRDGAGGILYTFAGNCAVQYPVSSGSYMGIVASLASIAGGAVATVASGGALAPVAMGAVSGMLNAHTRVSHSGAFSGNAGAMGVKTPYLIITRPQTCLADNFPAFDGYPANKTTTLGVCSGFVKCETCHVENIPATDAELSEIEMLLKGGIII